VDRIAANGSVGHFLAPFGPHEHVDRSQHESSLPRAPGLCIHLSELEVGLNAGS
jgi:hypothetical protein